MNFYVRLNDRLTRKERLELGVWLIDAGIKKVDYSEGGWDDHTIGRVAPHLKFKNERDALTYILAFGGAFSETIPTVDDKVAA